MKVINKIMTMPEIDKDFYNLWVLIENPDRNEDFEVTGGKVLYASDDKDEILDAASKLDLQSSAFFHIGGCVEENIFI